MMHFLCIGKRYALNKPIKYINYLSLYRQSSLVFLLICLFSFHFVCFAQESGESSSSSITLTGQVSSAADGKRLQGATITAGEKYTITDSKGEFSIQAPSNNGVLKVRHIGYQDQIINYSLETKYIYVKLNALESEIEEVEVVSTGYQQLPKERATGSFEFIDNELFNTRSGSNVLERLEGLVPGLQFDNRKGSPTINIRGINTFSQALSEPLIVVDNFPYNGDLANLNPNEVESVTILKDAAATSIWGARAGNGVIVITTKRFKEKTNVSYSSSYNLREKENLFYDSRINSADFMEVERFLFGEKHYDAVYYGNERTKKSRIFSPYVHLLYKEQNGLVEQDVVDRFVAEHRNIDFRNEMLDLFYRRPFEQQHYLAFSNSTARLSNRVTVGYDQRLGSKVGMKNRRLNLRAISKLDISKNISVEGRLAFTDGTDLRNADMMDYNYSPGGGKFSLYPYARFRDHEGTALPLAKNYNLEYLQSLESLPILDWVYYPADEMDYALRSTHNQQVNAQLILDVRPMAGLSLNLNYNLETGTNEGDVLYTQESFYTRDLINRFTQIDGDKITNIMPEGAIKSSSFGSFIGHNLRGQAQYNTNLNNEHDISILMGGEISDRENISKSFRLFGYDIDLMTSQPIDPINRYPIIDGLAADGRLPSVDNTQSKSVRRYVSVYTNMGYTFKDRYGLSISARKDASNIFGVKTNDKWNPLWSTGASWSLHKESFLQNHKWINNLRLRATYGHSGNSGGGANILPVLSYQSAPPGAITLLNRARVSVLSNASLRWEDVRTINLGMDYTLLSAKLSGSIEVYDKKSTDLLAPDRMDITTGFTTTTRNVGELKGRGIDIRISSNYNLGNVEARSTVNFSYSRSLVTDYYGTVGSGSTLAQNRGQTFYPIMDKPLYPVYSYKFVGLDPENGDPLGFFQGEVSKEYSRMRNDSIQNLEYHGTSLPPYYGSYIQQVKWKEWTLSFLISYKFGHYFKKYSIDYASLFNSWTGHGDFENRWQKPGDEQYTNIPSMVYPLVSYRDEFYAYSSANVLKGALVRLQDVGLDYSLRAQIGNYSLNGNISFKINNVGLLWKANKEGLDPDYHSIPPSRRYSLGININL